MQTFIAVIPIDGHNKSSWQRIIIKPDFLRILGEESIPVAHTSHISFIYNPSDLEPQQCDISFCIDCLELESTKIHTHKLAFWKPLMSLQTQVTGHLSLTDATNDKISEFSFSTMDNQEIHFNTQKNMKYTSDYPIITVNFRTGIETTMKYLITANMISRYKHKTLTIPNVDNLKQNYIFLSDRREADGQSHWFSYLLPNVYETKSMVFKTSASYQTFYWLSVQGMHNCTDDITVTIKEATISNCPTDDSTEIVPYKITAYNLNQILDMPIQSGPKSCLYSIIVRRKTLAKCCTIIIRQGMSGYWFSKLVKALQICWRNDNQNNYAEIKTSFRLYRWNF